MRGIFVDDEKSAHANFKECIRSHPEVKQVNYFFQPEKAVHFACENHIDCAFLDIVMPDIQGIQLAKTLKNIQPQIQIVFISDCDDYAREAYKIGACAYLSNPYTAEELSAAMMVLKKLTVPDPLVLDLPHIFVKTFGHFDLFVDSAPVVFKTAKAKELLAFLIQLRGSTATSAQIFLALWERQEYGSTTSTYVRRTIRALKDTLKEYGVEQILIAQRNCISVDTTQFLCDYYQLLDGDPIAVRQYGGAYMDQYSWGEPTIPIIERVIWDMDST